MTEPKFLMDMLADDLSSYLPGKNPLRRSFASSICWQRCATSALSFSASRVLVRFDITDSFGLTLLGSCRHFVSLKMRDTEAVEMVFPNHPRVSTTLSLLVISLLVF